MKFNLTLKGKDQFYSKLNNKIYNILVVDTKEKLSYMNKKFKEFNNDKTIIGLDFEFRKVSKESKEIAIAQINLENDRNDAYIFIFYPPKLNKKGLGRFIRLLTNKDIIKVLHGGESLDIHYLFDSILKDDDKIQNFIYNLYDTKFLCEYYHIEKNIINKCSIYNFLEEFKIIDKKNIKYLNDLENKIGEIYLVEFDINNLNNNLIEYALYDVIYLPTLINKIISISDIFKITIKELTGIIYYYKRVKHDEFSEFFKKVNSFNNYFINLNDDKIKLVDIYYYYYYYDLPSLTLHRSREPSGSDRICKDKFLSDTTVVTEVSGSKASLLKQNRSSVPLELANNLIIKLSEITYFKNFIETLLKYIIYRSVSVNASQIDGTRSTSFPRNIKEKIYSSNDTITNEKLNINLDDFLMYRKNIINLFKCLNI